MRCLAVRVASPPCIASGRWWPTMPLLGTLPKANKIARRLNQPVGPESVSHAHAGFVSPYAHRGCIKGAATSGQYRPGGVHLPQPFVAVVLHESGRRAVARGELVSMARRRVDRDGPTNHERVGHAVGSIRMIGERCRLGPVWGRANNLLMCGTRPPSRRTDSWFGNRGLTVIALLTSLPPDASVRCGSCRRSLRRALT